LIVSVTVLLCWLPAAAEQLNVAIALASVAPPRFAVAPADDGTGVEAETFGVELGSPVQ
jgi:hypothetical protein